MATLTSNYATAAGGIQPKGVHAGTFSVVFSYDNGIGLAAAKTLSTGDTILMGRIATGVTILDGYFIQSVGDTGSSSVGIDGSVVDLMASQSTSGGEMVRLGIVTNSLPRTISVSDAATLRYATVKIGVDADYTTTTQFKIVLHCARDI